MSGGAPVVLAGVGAGFPSIEPERAVLAEIDARVIDARDLSDAEVLELASGADAILTDYYDWSADAVASLERCRVICQYGIGVDRIDLDAAVAAGIRVTNTPEYCLDEMADHALALMLAVTRNITRYDRDVRNGGWDYKAGPSMRRLRTLTLGLVGAGRIGTAFASRAQGLGLRVLACDPGRAAADLAAEGIEACELDEVLRRADIVSLHLPLTPSTRELLNHDRLSTMKPGAVLINTARGGLVDQEALTEHLRSGHLGGAGLDVLSAEPPDPAEPLLTLENVVVTPHAGFLSTEALHDVQTQAAEEARRAVQGAPALNAIIA